MKITPELLKTMEIVFSNKSMIVAGEVLTRKELRCLERHGYVEKIPFFERSKYVDGVAQKKYLWRRTMVKSNG